ncbi:hypothetical protein DPX39_040061300 [Trypanosoma brucei equiperdum]|uniref:Uncharacterized protein n=1 Tax=Trypanosoma brucei equiperdum TaxID=630700 RepID=A0A3L6LA95_9TRYP|nr:hypothetical protein DPX39_040061300 [Trypanosoma brucei equiperdum]
MISPSTLLRSASSRGPFSAALRRLFSQYPRNGGEFLGNLLVGHNVFIADQPRKYDVCHARHFSLLESLNIVPLFTLTVVHYFSTFLLFPSRRNMIPVLMTELTNKSKMEQEWLEALAAKSPADAVAWRAAMLLSHLVLFPMFLILSAIAPQLVHATLERTNEILYQKYASISTGAPTFVKKCMEDARDASTYHSMQLNISTDYVAALIIVVLVLYLNS